MKAGKRKGDVGMVHDVILEAGDGIEDAAYGVKEQTSREHEVSAMDKKELFRVASEIDAHKLDEQLATKLVEVGLAGVVVTRLGRGEKFSADFADRLIEDGYGLAVLANERNFSGLVLDEDLVSRLLKTQSIDEHCAVNLRSNIHDGREFLTVIKQERLRLLGVLIQRREGRVNEEPDKMAAHIGVDGELLGDYTEKNGQAGVEHVLFVLDKSFSSWEKSPEWKWAVQKYFRLSPGEIFNNHKIKEIKTAVADYNYALPDEPSPLVIEKKWAVDQTLLANREEVDSAVINSLSVVKDYNKIFQISETMEDRQAADKLLGHAIDEYDEKIKHWTQAEDLIIVAKNANLNEAYASIVARIFASDELFSGDENGLISFDSARIIHSGYAENVAVNDPSSVMDAYSRFLGLRNSQDFKTFMLNSMFTVTTESLPENLAQDVVAQTMQHLETSDDKQEALHWVEGSLIASSHGKLSSQGIEFQVARGVPVNGRMVETWKKCCDKKDRTFLIHKNLEALASLERAREGCVKVLQQEFGIDNFARYSEEMLLDQYDTRDDSSIPYGIVLNPKSDYNGAFNRKQITEDSLVGMHRELKGHYYLRIYEAGSRIDVARTLIKIKQRYIEKGGGKIAYALIGGHGSKDTIAFGDGEAEIRTRDLSGRGAGRTGSDFFEPNATVILRSCSTGVEGGIGQRMSEVLQVKVIAPETPTNIDEIKVSYSKDGKPQFVVHYNEDVAKTYLNGANE